MRPVAGSWASTPIKCPIWRGPITGWDRSARDRSNSAAKRLPPCGRTSTSSTRSQLNKAYDSHKEVRDEKVCPACALDVPGCCVLGGDWIAADSDGGAETLRSLSLLETDARKYGRSLPGGAGSVATANPPGRTKGLRTGPKGTSGA